MRERAGETGVDQFEFVARQVDGSRPVDTRATAVEILATAQLNSEQLTRLAGLLENVSPLDVSRLLAAFANSQDEQVALALVDSLKRAPARSAARCEYSQANAATTLVIGSAICCRALRLARNRGG